MYLVAIAPYGNHVFLTSKVPFLGNFTKEKSLHMQMTVIFPYIIVWDMLNEITCLSKFYVTGFYCPVLLQYFDASWFICSVTLYVTVQHRTVS